MSVYIARRIRPDAKKTKDAIAFTAKKLAEYFPSPINQLAITGVPHYKEVAYELYRANIDAFVFATLTKETVFCEATAFDNITVKELQVPFPTIPVAFAPRVKMSVDQKTRFVGKLGPGAHYRDSGPVTEFVVPEPSINAISSYIQVSNTVHNAGNQKLSPYGFAAYVKLRTILEGFLATNWYPAFKDHDSDIPEENRDGTLVLLGEDNRKEKRHFYSSFPNLKKDHEKVAEAHAVLKRRKIMKGPEVVEREDVEGEDVEMADEEEVELPDLSGTISADFGSLTSMTTKAKPSGRPATINFGGVGAVPALPGLVFPYFDGLNQPDYTTIKEVITNRFFRLFGKTIDECKAEIINLRRGINNLCAHKVGMVMTHIFKGIDLALCTQTQLFLVYSGTKYLGFCLLGAHFSIYDGGRWRDAVSNEQIKDELRDLDSHSNALFKLAEELSKLTLKNRGGKADITTVDIDTPVKLMREMSLRVTKDEKEVVEAIDEQLEKVIWSKAYRKITPGTFQNLLESIRDEKPLGDNDVFFIRSITHPFEERLYQLLGEFGPDAPGLWNTSGDTYPIIAEDIRRRKVPGVGEASVELKDPECPEEILIRPQKLIRAYTDWRDFVIKQASVRFNKRERAREHNCHVVKEKVAREGIWRVLKEVVRKHASKDKGEGSSKKRKTDDAEIAVVTFEDIDALDFA